jgi:hypothetical protein
MNCELVDWLFVISSIKKVKVTVLQYTSKNRWKKKLKQNVINNDFSIVKEKHISNIFTAISNEYLVLINWNLLTKIEGKLDSIVPLLKAMI